MARIFICVVVFVVEVLAVSIFSCAQPKPSEFNVYKVDVNPTEVLPSENVTVTAIIGNIGGVADNYTAVFEC